MAIGWMPCSTTPLSTPVQTCSNICCTEAHFIAIVIVVKRKAIERTNYVGGGESTVFCLCKTCFDGFSLFHFACCLHTFHQSVYSHDEHPFLCSLHRSNVADGICSIHSSIMQTIRQTKWTHTQKTNRTKRITSESEIYFCLFFEDTSLFAPFEMEIFLHLQWFWRIKNAKN